MDHPTGHNRNQQYSSGDREGQAYLQWDPPQEHFLDGAGGGGGIILTPSGRRSIKGEAISCEDLIVETFRENPLTLDQPNIAMLTRKVGAVECKKDKEAALAAIEGVKIIPPPPPAPSKKCSCGGSHWRYACPSLSPDEQRLHRLRTYGRNGNIYYYYYYILQYLYISLSLTHVPVT